MEIFTLSQFPSPYSTVHLALFKNITNAAEIRAKLIAAAGMTGPEGDLARKEVEFGFIDASMIVSLEHLMTAIQMTLLLSFPIGATIPKTRTHNLHSEILLMLFTNNIISEAIKKLGISDKTQTLLVIRFGEGEQQDVWGAMEKVVKGELIPLSSLNREGIADWKGIDKLHKLSELNRLPLTSAEIREKKIAAVVSSTAVKTVL